MLEFKRRKKKTKKKLPPMFGQPTAHLANVDHLDPLELELSQYPRIMTLPNFRPPGKLINVNRTLPGSPEYQQWFYNFSHIVKLPESPDDSKVQILRQLFDINATGLMVAKIAYCFAVAELGMSGFRGDEIRQLICNEKDNEVYNFFGGSLDDERLTNRYLHGLAFRERAGFLTVICIRQGCLEQRIAVGRRAHDCFSGDVGAGAWSVLHDEWPTKPLRKPLAHQSRHDVGWTTCAHANDNAHRLRRIGLRPHDARHRRQHGSTSSQMQKISAAE
jgi:hypothetical protein